MTSIEKTDIREAQSAPKWCALNDMAAKDAIEDCIKHAYTLKGMTWTFDTLRIAGQELGMYILKKFGHLTTAEVRLALDSGARGELGNKDTYLTIANMQTWVRTYAGSQERVDALNDMHEERLSAKALPEGTEEERNRRMWEERPQSLFRYTRENGTIWTMGNDDGLAVAHLGAMIWDMLESQGVTEQADRAIDENELVCWYDLHKDRPREMIESSTEDRRKCLQLERCFLRLIAEGRELEYRVA